MGSNPPLHVPRTHGGPTHVVGVPHAPWEGEDTDNRCPTPYPVSS